MSRNFQLQLMRKALGDLGYAEVGKLLAQKMATESDRLHENNSSSNQSPFIELIAIGDYESLLSILCGSQDDESNRTEGSANSGADVRTAETLDIEIDDNGDASGEFHFVSRTAYLEKVLLKALDAPPLLSDQSDSKSDVDAVEYLQKRVSVAFDALDRTDEDIPFLQKLTKEQESGVLLPLAMSPPSRGEIDTEFFNSKVMLTSVKHSLEGMVQDDYTYLARLRNTLTVLLRHTLGIPKTDVSGMSMLDYNDIPDDCLSDIIHKATLYNEWQSLYHLPPRMQYSSDVGVFNDYAFLEEATRDDLPIHLLHTLSYHTDEVWFTRFSPSGRFLATGSLDGTCMIYDVLDHFRLVAELDANSENDSAVFVEGSHVPPLDKKKGIIYFSWEPHERFIVTCCLDTVIRIWNVENIAPKRRTRSMNGSENASLVACFALGERMRTWSCEFLKYDRAATPHFIVGSPDKVLKVFSIDGTEVLDFYSDADEWLSILGDDPPPPSAATTDPPGSSLGVRRAEETMHVASEDSTSSGNGASQFNRINDLAITPNGRVLITANNDKQVLFYKIPNLFDPSTTTSRIALLSLNGRLTSCNISADGKYMLLSIAPEELQLWEISPLDTFDKPFLKQKFLGQSQALYMVRSSFGYLTSPQMREKLVLSGSDDGFVYIWKLETGQLVTRVKGHEGLCNSVDWNRFYAAKSGTDYGKYWCSVGDDQLVKVWGPRDAHSKPTYHA